MLKDKSTKTGNNDIKKIDEIVSSNPSLVTSALSVHSKIEKSKSSLKIERSAQNTQDPCFTGMSV